MIRIGTGVLGVMAVGVAIAAGGCGSDSSSSDNGGTPPANNGQDAGQDSAAPQGDAAVAATPAVWISTGITADQSGIAGAYANVYNAKGNAGDPCVPTDVNGCLVVDCRGLASASVTGRIKFGDLTISNGTDSLTFSHDDSGEYSASGPTPIWNDNDTISFSAPGGPEIGAINQSLQLLPALPLLSPTVAKPSLNRNKTFTATWSATNSGTKAAVTLIQNSTTDTTLFVSATCECDLSALSCSMPPAVLSHFDPSNSMNTTTLVVTAIDEVDTVAGDTPVRLTTGHGPSFPATIL